MALAISVPPTAGAMGAPPFLRNLGQPVTSVVGQGARA